MWIIYDLAVLGIVALCTFIGYKQGLVKSAIKILSFFIAIIVALILYKPVSNTVIKNTYIDDNIKNVMIQKIKPEGVDINQQLTVENNSSFNIMGVATSTIEEITNVFTVKLIETVTLLLIFIIVKIAIKFVSAFTDLITKLPLLKQVNKLGGTIYGIIKGMILVYTILVVYLVMPLLNKAVSKNIDKSVLTKMLYNNNIILNIIV